MYLVFLYMDRFSHNYIPLTSSSTRLAERAWKYAAFSFAVLLVTFISKRSQESFMYMQSPDFEIVAEKDNDPLLVFSRVGTFNGSYDESGGIVWQGIRFGKFPLRFASPVLAEPLPLGEIYQNYNSPACIQESDGSGANFYHNPQNPGATMSEDCLFLSVYAPSAPKGNDSNGYPVQVYFHAGGFQYGETLDYPGFDMSAFSNNGIISVVTNYRMGLFGTFTMGNVSGNFGFQDQQLALTWVKLNIAAFGGDPNKVTISGCSSGAQSVAAHLASPASHGLYSAAAIGSWPAGILFPTVEFSRNVTRAYAIGAGCGADDVACMRNLTYQTILAHAGNVPAYLKQHLCTYGMFVDPDGDLPVQPFIAIKEGRYPDVPLLVSFDRDEAIEMVYGSITSALSDEEYSTDVSVFVDRFMNLEDKSWAAMELLKLYPYTSGTVDGRPLINELATDGLSACPSIHMYEGAVANQKPPIFVYVFDHVYTSCLNASQVWMHDAVLHGSDYECVISNPVVTLTLDAEEKQFCRGLNSAFSNFIQYGDPNFGRPLFPSMHFPRLNSSGEILRMDIESTVGTYFRYDLCLKFWNAVQPIPDS